MQVPFQIDIQFWILLGGGGISEESSRGSQVSDIMLVPDAWQEGKAEASGSAKGCISDGNRLAFLWAKGETPDGYVASLGQWQITVRGTVNRLNLL